MLVRNFLKAAMGVAVLSLGSALAQTPAGGRGGQPAAPAGPWMNKALSPDERADLVIKEMTIDEKIQLVHGGSTAAPAGGASRSNGGAGFVPGIQRLNIPDVNMADSAVGITRGAAMGRYSTLLPSTLGAASSWNTEGAYLYGTVIGRELRAQGYNMSIGGGVNVTREERNGRNFEYAGEDPILAGMMTGYLMKGVQSQQIMGDLKHYAVNDQETGRNIGNATASKRVLRETDLLAFEIALRESNAAGFMCSYNKINGDWACENDYLLNQVLKKTFGFKGWVMSDWGGTHTTTKAALAGLDQEQPGSGFFGDNLKKAIAAGEVPAARLDDMVHRILRSMFAVGVIDNPPVRDVPDVFQGLEDAQKIAEESIVLVKNANGQLPLNAAAVKSIAVIGSHADVGVLSGGGSAQVNPSGGNAVKPAPGAAPAPAPAGGMGMGRVAVYSPLAPLKAIRAKAPNAKVTYNEGTDPAAAAAVAKGAEVAIVFVNQPMSEGRDSATLNLPENQDALVAAVAAANPHTIIVTENGGPLAMPWIANVPAVMVAWFPGVGGAPAIANLLFGDVNPSAKLPVSFAKTHEDLPMPKIPGIDLAPVVPPGGGRGALPNFEIPYGPEGLKVGYKWFDAENKEPLFAFGHGLSYTTYSYSGMTASASGRNVKVSFQVKNDGKRPGVEIAQIYAALPASAGEPPKRLVGWQRVALNPGESKTVTLTIDPLYLSVFDEAKDAWSLLPGDYKLMAGASSRTLPLSAPVRITQ